MNLIEAVKSEKPFRRIGDRPWYKEIDKDEKGIVVYGNNNFFYPNTYLDVEDILADDWEVKE